MTLPAVLPAADTTPSPVPSETTTPAVPTIRDAHESAAEAATWVEQNWSTWLAIGLRVLLIVVIAAILRVFVRRAITKLIDRMSRAPARAFNLPGGTLAKGSPADVAVFSSDREWVVQAERFFSLSRNTPFAGWKLTGQPIATIVDGRIAWRSTPK